MNRPSSWLLAGAAWRSFPAAAKPGTAHEGVVGRGGGRAAGAIGVERSGEPVAAQHRMQGAQRGLGALSRPELRVEQILGRIVDDRDQDLMLFRSKIEPDVLGQGPEGVPMAYEQGAWDLTGRESK